MQMESEGNIFALSPINSAGEYDFAKESELKPQEKMQRKRQAPNELPKRKGKGKILKKERGQGEGEPSDAESKGKEESVKEFIFVKKKSVLQALKILRHRADRRIKIDEMADMLNCIGLLRFVMEHIVLFLFSPIVESLNKIISQWPARSDLNDIKKHIKDMEDKERNKAKQPRHDDDDDDEMMDMDVIRELEKIEHDIKSLDEKREQDSAKANELAELFTTEGISVDTLREKLSTAFPWLFWGEIATNKLPRAKGKGKRKGKAKEVPVKELIKKKIFVAKILKILRDRVNRRIKIGQRADMESCIRLMCFVIEHRVDCFFSPIVQSLNKIKSQWTTRSDLDGIKKDIKQMEVELRERKMEVITGDMIRRLEEIEQKIKSSDKEFLEDSEKAIDLEEIFTTEGVSVETLREKLTTAFPWLFLEEIATNELPSAINLEEEIFTTEEETAGIDSEGQMCEEGIDGNGDNGDNKSQTTSNMTPSNDPYGIPLATKVLDKLPEVPEDTDFYYFCLDLLTSNYEKRQVFLSMRPERRARWLKREMEDNSIYSNGP